MSNSKQDGPPSVEIPEARLDEKSLMEEAMKNTGLSDFGEESFLEGFRRLLDSLENEARLTPIGCLIAHGLVLRNLENRLSVTEDWKRYPEMGKEEIVKPVFVVGLPRTGSTILHDLPHIEPEAPLSHPLVDTVLA